VLGSRLSCFDLLRNLLVEEISFGFLLQIVRVVAVGFLLLLLPLLLLLLLLLVLAY